MVRIASVEQNAARACKWRLLAFTDVDDIAMEGKA